MNPTDPTPPPATDESHAPARRGWFREAGAWVLLLGGVDLVRGANLVAVRVWPAADYTRVTLESDEALQASHFAIDEPPRLVIDIDALELSPQLRELVAKVGADDPHIARVRVGQSQPRRVRMVFDLKTPSVPQVFALAPIAPYRHRLVFDLRPVTPPDPLLQLAQGPAQSRPGATRPASAAPGTAPTTATTPSTDAAQASAQAASDLDDALGEFIGRMGPRPGGDGSVSPALPPRLPPAPSLPSPAAPSLPPFRPAPGTMNRLIVVAIDPGHGGEDPGATGPSGLREKDVVLQIALQLAEQVNARAGMRAMLTRDADFFVPLQDRVHKAQRVQADLFVSIHADAFLTPTARGASVFALSDRGASSAAARWMAQRENQADAIGGIDIKAKDRHVLQTLLDMSTSAQIKDSLRVGREVLGNIGRIGQLHRGEVEQAGFAVLKAPDIPSILVETGFISNPTEESRLRDPDYQARLVRALHTGITRYFARNPPLARTRQS